VVPSEPGNVSTTPWSFAHCPPMEHPWSVGISSSLAGVLRQNLPPRRVGASVGELDVASVGALDTISEGTLDKIFEDVLDSTLEGAMDCGLLVGVSLGPFLWLPILVEIHLVDLPQPRWVNKGGESWRAS